MAGSRDAYIRLIESRLGGSHLLWWGTRSTDARSLLALDQFRGAFSLISPFGFGRRDDFAEACLETLSSTRPDLNAYTIDRDRSEAAESLRQQLSDAWRSGTHLAPYRPCDFISAAWFPRRDRCGYLGMFLGQQEVFEHKPWVETSLRDAGVRTIEWQYYANDDIHLIDEAAFRGPRVLRANRSDGGIGVSLLEEGELAGHHLPKHNDLFVGVAPLLEPNIPLNVGGCVFPEGAVTVHSPSVQLIGIPGLTGRRFAYCGNDFARVGELLDRRQLADLERMVRTVGTWLHSQGYVGAFGIDALLYEDEVILTEVNPRFQGSTEASAALDGTFGLPDVVLEHVAAFLDLEAPQGLPSLAEVAAAQSSTGHRLSHVICHNTSELALARSEAALGDLPVGEVLCAPADGVQVLEEGVLLKLSWPDAVTPDGFSIADAPDRVISSQAAALYGEARLDSLG